MMQASYSAVLLLYPNHNLTKIGYLSSLLSWYDFPYMTSLIVVSLKHQAYFLGKLSLLQPLVLVYSLLHQSTWFTSHSSYHYPQLLALSHQKGQNSTPRNLPKHDLLGGQQPHFLLQPFLSYKQCCIPSTTLTTLLSYLTGKDFHRCT